MKTIKNIVIINDYDYIQGGASKVAIETANLLVQKKYNVYFFCGCTSDVNSLDRRVKRVCTNNGEYLKNNNKIVGALRGLYDCRSKRMLKQLLESLDKDETIIHVHGWTKALSSSVFSVIFSKKVKMVMTLHDYFAACPNGGFFNYHELEICELKPLSLRCILCDCDSRSYAFKVYRVLRQFIQNKIVRLNKRLENVIYLSDMQFDVLTRYLKNKDITSRKIQNPIDFAGNKRVDYRHNKYYLYVGRLSKEKGVEYFCEACDKAGFKGIIVGDGNNLEDFKRKYPKLDFVGWKERDDVYRYMLKAKALVFPSLWYEGSPLIIDEAINAGLPCIVSDRSSATEKIVPNKNGLIYEAKNIKKLIDCMRRVDSIDYEMIDSSIGDVAYADELIKYYNDIMGK